MTQPRPPDDVGPPGAAAEWLEHEAWSSNWRDAAAAAAAAAAAEVLDEFVQNIAIDLQHMSFG